MGNLSHRSFCRSVWLSREAANPVNPNIILLCHTEGGEGKQSIRGSKPDSVQQCTSGWWLGSRLQGPSPLHKSICLKIFLCNRKCTWLEVNYVFFKAYSLCSDLCILFSKDWPEQKIKIYFFSELLYKLPISHLFFNQIILEILTKNANCKLIFTYILCRCQHCFILL